MKTSKQESTSDGTSSKVCHAFVLHCQQRRPLEQQAEHAATAKKQWPTATSRRCTVVVDAALHVRCSKRIENTHLRQARRVQKCAMPLCCIASNVCLWSRKIDSCEHAATAGALTHATA